MTVKKYVRKERKKTVREDIFRKKNLDKVNSPENLNDYIKVSNPGMWLIIAAVLVLIAGACIWGFFGHIDTSVPTTATVENGVAYFALESEDVNEGTVFEIGGEKCVVDTVENSEAGLARLARAKTSLPDGKYEAKIITESVKPISFILN